MTRLGFKGATVNGYSSIDGDIAYLDEGAFVPLWEGVVVLGVPQ